MDLRLRFRVKNTGFILSFGKNYSLSRWIEVWQRKRRQYLCGESPSLASFTNPEYTCRHTDDDLRIAACANKNNQSVIEVLKADIECGWSSAAYINKFSFGILIILALGLLTI